MILVTPELSELNVGNNSSDLESAIGWLKKAEGSYPTFTTGASRDISRSHRE